METIKTGSWVRIYDVVLEASDRAANLPEDTSKVPLEMWNKGVLQQEAKIGERVQIKTLTNRIVEGKLLEVNPTYTHSFGKFVPEILPIGRQLKNILRGGETDE